MISLDSNILAYAADNLAGPRHLQAEELLRSAHQAGAALTEQSIFELLNVSTIKAKRSTLDTVAIIRELTANFRVLYPPLTIVEDVLRLLQSHKLNVWDARMLVVCAANGCDYLLSEDMQDGAQYGGVTVIDPFKPRNAAIIEQVMSL